MNKFVSEYRAHLKECMGLLTLTEAIELLFTEYRALLTEYRALLTEHRALLIEYRALLAQPRALLGLF